MKNKKIANRLLIILLIIFILNLLLKKYFHNSFYTEMCSFVIEAALVGSIADWFAVTALFEKPLGFPWHTAIIPRNRDKVVDAVASMVENELLGKEILEEKIGKLNIIDSAFEFIENSDEFKTHFYTLVEGLCKKIISNVNADDISEYIEKGFKNALGKLDLSIYLSKILDFAMKNEECEKLFNVLLDELIIKINEDKAKDGIADIINKTIDDNISKMDGLKRMLVEIALKIGSGTNTVNINDAAVSIQTQIGETLDSLKDEQDPIHIEFIEKLQCMIEKLQKDENMIRVTEQWKHDTIDKISVKEELNQIIANLYTDNFETVTVWLKKMLNEYLENLKADYKLRNIIENYIKEVIYELIKSCHSYIGIAVKKVLNNMTDESLNKFIELKAGNDLHWIRINGCIISALFGLFVFLTVNKVYFPLVARLFH